MSAASRWSAEHCEGSSNARLVITPKSFVPVRAWKPDSLFKTNSALLIGRPDHSTVSLQSFVWWKIRLASIEPARVPPGNPLG